MQRRACIDAETKQQPTERSSTFLRKLRSAQKRCEMFDPGFETMTSFPDAHLNVTSRSSIAPSSLSSLLVALASASISVRRSTTCEGATWRRLIGWSQSASRDCLSVSDALRSVLSGGE